MTAKSGGYFVSVPRTLGIEGGELMAAVQMAMLGQLPYTTLREAVFAHPTLAESLNNLFATLEG